MKTDDLVAALARNAGRHDARGVARRFTLPHVLAAVLCLAVVALAVGPRADWRQAALTPMPWVKQAFPGAVMLASFAWLRRLAYPGMRAGAMPAVLVLPFLAIWVLALLALGMAPAQQRLDMVVGTSWRECLGLISLLAIPAFALSVHALRGMAPTRLRLAGAVAGLFAGSSAAFAYAVGCSETRAPFLAVWYALGMLVPAAAGACLGRRLLRW